MSTRRTLWDVVRDVLRRQEDASEKPRTRISHVKWARSHEVVRPERELSQWVRSRSQHPGISEWDAIVRGDYKEK